MPLRNRNASPKLQYYVKSNKVNNLFFFLTFWLYYAAHGILVPQPGIELTFPTLEVLTTGLPGKPQQSFSIKSDIQPVLKIFPPVYLN